MPKIVQPNAISPPQTSPTRSTVSRSEFEITSSRLPQAVILWDPSASRSPPTLSELLASEPVTLTIGFEQTRTTIHRILFRGLSEPLHQLLNSHCYGHLSEINATLKFDDADAFLQLVRIAYKIASNDSAVSRFRLEVALSNRSQIADLMSVNGSQIATEMKTLKCNNCKRGYIRPTMVCGSCNSIHSVNNLYASNGLKDFMHATFIHHANLSSKLNTSIDVTLDLKTPSGQSHSLLHFARVFSLAQKYDILDLVATSLRAFERRLKRFAKDSGVREDDEVYDVLRYFGSESVSDPDEDNPLRRCLMRYVASKLDELVVDGEFREIMIANGILGLELAQVLAEVLVTAGRD